MEPTHRRHSEIGPGKTLTSFVKKTAPGIQTYHIDIAADFETVAEQLKDSPMTMNESVALVTAQPALPGHLPGAARQAAVAVNYAETNSRPGDVEPAGPGRSAEAFQADVSDPPPADLIAQ